MLSTVPRKCDACAEPSSVKGGKPDAAGSANPLWSRLARAGGPLQAKLRVGAVDDPLEREADRVAEAVVSGSAASPAVQRKCAACEEEDMHRSAVEPPIKEEEKLQTKRPAGAAPEVSPKTASRIASFRGGGEALSPTARSYFEPRFGRDLSAVRLHTGSEAATTAGEIQARAFTVGQDIAFGAHEYRPETAEGRRLLAHELTHTVQQGADRTIRRTDYTDCTDDQLSNLVLPAKRRAITDLDAVIPMLSENPLASLVRAALFLAFRSDSATTVEGVRDTLQEIRDGIENGTVQCEQPNGWQYMCEHNRLGYTNFAGTIHLCMNAWPGSTARLRTLNIIHEGAHAFSWMIGDSGYFSYSTCEETASTSRLPTHVRRGTPDAYSCFVSYLRYDSGIEARAQSYRGADLAIAQSPGGPIDLNGSDPRNPIFSITGIPSHGGFRFRWVIADSDDRRYLMRNDAGSTFDFGDFAQSYIGTATRALLRERGIRQASVLCRVDIPGATERLLTQQVALLS